LWEKVLFCGRKIFFIRDVTCLKWLVKRHVQTFTMNDLPPFLLVSTSALSHTTLQHKGLSNHRPITDRESEPRHQTATAATSAVGTFATRYVLITISSCATKRWIGNNESSMRTIRTLSCAEMWSGSVTWKDRVHHLHTVPGPRRCLLFPSGSLACLTLKSQLQSNQDSNNLADEDANSRAREQEDANQALDSHVSA